MEVKQKSSDHRSLNKNKREVRWKVLLWIEEVKEEGETKIVGVKFTCEAQLRHYCLCSTNAFMTDEAIWMLL